MEGEKRQKGENRAVARVNKAGFVKSMLYAVSDSLAGDAEYGSNSANRIRRHVESIAKTVDKNKEDTKEGRAVLDARFALGFDDGQYLAQAVSLLWAGDGGERLRVVPSEMMPTIMRQASAVGLVKAMDSVIDHKNKMSNNMIKETLNLVAFLLEMSEIRLPVLTYMMSFDLDLIKRAAESIQREYAGSRARGRAEIASLITSTEPEKFEIIQSMMEGLIVLLDPTSHPAKIFSRLMTTVSGVVNKTAKETALVFEMAVLFGPMNDDTEPSKEDMDEYESSDLYKEFDMCPKYDPSGMPQTDPSDDNQHVEIALLKAAVSEAFDRMRACNRSWRTNADTNVTSRAFDPNSTKKEWDLQRIVSPMWNQDDASINCGQKLAGGWYSYLPDPVPEFDDVLDKLETLLSQSPTSSLDVEARPIRDNRLSSDTLFVDFAMIRGLCGYRGPHQEDVGGDLPYSFPQSGIKGYERAQYLNITDVDLDKNDSASITARQSLIYSDHKSVVLNTDFVGHVIKDERRAPRDDLDAADYGAEPAKPVRWAPIHKDMKRKGDEIVYDEAAHSICAASTLEFMISSLTQHAETEMAHDNMKRANILYAAAGVAKLNQLSSLIFSRNSRMSRNTKMVLNPQDARQTQYITRPGHQCGSCVSNNDSVLIENLHLPVDAGIARFTTDEAVPPALKIVQGDSPDDLDGYDASAPFGNMPIENVSINQWLRNSVLSGFFYDEDDYASTHTRKVWGLEIGVDAQHEPVDTTGQSSGGTARDLTASSLLDMDFSVSSLSNAIKSGFNAVREVEQLHHEAAYVQKIQKEGTAENVTVLGLGQTVESATRERRTAVWSDALREVSISTDRLYRFVTLLTGSIGEAADSAISWEDEDMKASQKEATQRQKALAERVARFQTKLVESVVSSTLKASKLQLDMRSESGVADKLVVMSQEVKDNVRQITSGEAGHGFFETSVELGNVLGAASKPMAVGELVRQLQSVSEAFHDQVSAEMASSGPASYSRIVEPRNSYMLHMKPDTIAAIQKSFDHITTELNHCYGYHRHIHLWEYVEGKDQTLVSRFAELVGLMLQNTRMRSGSFAAYVGQSQLIASGQNIKMQIQRLRLQACSYLMEQHTAPNFLSKHGRTIYFGGSIQPVGKEEKKAVSERSYRKRAQSSFGGDEGDDRFDDATFKPVFRYKPEIERRMRQYNRARRQQLSSALMNGISIEGPTTRAYANVGASIARFSDISPTGTSPITGDSYGNTAATGMHMLKEMCDTKEGIEAMLHSVGRVAYQQTGNTARLVGTEVCSAKSMQNAGEDSVYTLVCKELQKQSPALKTMTDSTGATIYDIPSTIGVHFPSFGATKQAYVLKMDLSAHGSMQKGRPVNRAFVDRVNKVLNDLMSLKNNVKHSIGGFYPLYYWQPHPKWSIVGQGPHDNTWVRAFSFQDVRWAQMMRERTTIIKTVGRSLGANSSTIGKMAVGAALVSAAAYGYKYHTLAGMGETISSWVSSPSPIASSLEARKLSEWMEKNASKTPVLREDGSIPLYSLHPNGTTGGGIRVPTTEALAGKGNSTIFIPMYATAEALVSLIAEEEEKLKGMQVALRVAKRDEAELPSLGAGGTDTGVRQNREYLEEQVAHTTENVDMLKTGLEQVEKGINPDPRVTATILNKTEIDEELRHTGMVDNFQKWYLEAGIDSIRDANIMTFVETIVTHHFHTKGAAETLDIDIVMERVKSLWSGYFTTTFQEEDLVTNGDKLLEKLNEVNKLLEKTGISTPAGELLRRVKMQPLTEDEKEAIALRDRLVQQRKDWITNEILVQSDGAVGTVYKNVLSFMSNGESDAAQLWVAMAMAGGDLQAKFIKRFSDDFFHQLTQAQLKAATRKEYLEQLEKPLEQIFDKFVVADETPQKKQALKEKMLGYIKAGQLDKYMKLILGRFLQIRENLEVIAKILPKQPLETPPPLEGERDASASGSDVRPAVPPDPTGGVPTPSPAPPDPTGGVPTPSPAPPGAGSSGGAGKSSDDTVMEDVEDDTLSKGSDGVPDDVYPPLNPSMRKKKKAAKAGEELKKKNPAEEPKKKNPAEELRKIIEEEMERLDREKDEKQ